jgi:polysaccharide biosynthesis/export protein
MTKSSESEAAKFEISMCGRVVLLLVIGTMLTGCAASSELLGASGPTTGEVLRTGSSRLSGIQLVDVNDEVARRVLAAEARPKFSEIFPGGQPVGAIVGAGDTLEVSIWEAPPATLFSPTSLISAGAASAAGGGLGGLSGGGVTTLPDQVVSREGTIGVPYAGTIQAAGLTPEEIAADITRRLRGKAHDPQVLVRVTHNATATVTVLGEVGANQLFPLTSKGERVLDVVAAAGGVRQATDRITIQLTRGDLVETMPLKNIILDPEQDVVLKPGDVVTALYQPNSFTALGATGRTDEIPFEAQGITLAQALGRIGGLQDLAANPKGVFIFRFERPSTLGPDLHAPVETTPDGRAAVIYRVDMADPATFFVAQGFPIRNGDIIYVSEAPVAELGKFLAVLGNIVGPIATAKIAASQ